MLLLIHCHRVGVLSSLLVIGLPLMRNIRGTVWVYIQFIWKVVIKQERLTLSSLHTIDLNNHHPLIQQFSTLFSGCQDMGLETHMQVGK